jgi:hypothetical protein
VEIDPLSTSGTHVVGGGGGRERILAVAWIRMIIIINGKNAFLELNKSVSVATIIQVNTGFYPTPS